VALVFLRMKLQEAIGTEDGNLVLGKSKFTRKPAHPYHDADLEEARLGMWHTG
jgi:hypothetical protein